MFCLDQDRHLDRLSSPREDADNTKKSLYATEQNSDRAHLIRWLFRSVQRKIPACDVLFLDETAIHLSVTRAGGRAACNKRLFGHVPISRGQSVTQQAAL